MSDAARRQIAIFNPWSSLKVNPHTVAFINALEDAGYRADVFCDYIPDTPGQIPENCKGNVYLFSSATPIPLHISRYHCVVGIDHGIIPARAQADLLGIPCVFLSYEILFDEELEKHGATYYIGLKARMKNACNEIALAIIQDKRRGESLCREYAIASEKLLYMPVAGDAIVPYHRSAFLHSMLHLPEQTNILLHMGSLTKWAGVDSALARAASLPKGWVLVLHERYGAKHSFDIPASAASKVFFSTYSQDTPEGLARIIQSARCCLGLYQPTDEGMHAGRNIAEIGLASSKISTALQHGVPVAVNGTGEMADLIRRYGAGVVVDPCREDCFQALAALGPENFLHRACHALFQNELSIKNTMPELLERLASMPKELSALPGNGYMRKSRCVLIRAWLDSVVQSEESKQRLLLYFSMLLYSAGMVCHTFFNAVRAKIAKHVSKIT